MLSDPRARSGQMDSGKEQSSVLVKGSFECLDDPALNLTVPFNPTTFKISRSITWAEQPAHGQPYSVLQFSHGGSDTLQLKLLLDTTEEPGTVLDAVLLIYSWTTPLKVAEDVTRPPCMLFQWEHFRFQGVVKTLEMEFLIFDRSGRPKRAEATLVLAGQTFVTGQSSTQFFGQLRAPREKGARPNDHASSGDARMAAVPRWGG